MEQNTGKISDAQSAIEIVVSANSMTLKRVRTKLELTEKLLINSKNDLKKFTDNSIFAGSNKELLEICCHYGNEWFETANYSFSSLTNEFEKRTHVQLNAVSFRVLMGLYGYYRAGVDEDTASKFDTSDDVRSLYNRQFGEVK